MTAIAKEIETTLTCSADIKQRREGDKRFLLSGAKVLKRGAEINSSVKPEQQLYLIVDHSRHVSVRGIQLDEQSLDDCAAVRATDLGGTAGVVDRGEVHPRIVQRGTLRRLGDVVDCGVEEADGDVVGEEERVRGGN